MLPLRHWTRYEVPSPYSAHVSCHVGIPKAQMTTATWIDISRRGRNRSINNPKPCKLIWKNHVSFVLIRRISSLSPTGRNGNATSQIRPPWCWCWMASCRMSVPWIRTRSSYNIRFTGKRLHSSCPFRRKRCVELFFDALLNLVREFYLNPWSPTGWCSRIAVRVSTRDGRRGSTRQKCKYHRIGRCHYVRHCGGAAFR